MIDVSETSRRHDISWQDEILLWLAVFVLSMIGFSLFERESVVWNQLFVSILYGCYFVASYVVVCQNIEANGWLIKRTMVVALSTSSAWIVAECFAHDRNPSVWLDIILFTSAFYLIYEFWRQDISATNQQVANKKHIDTLYEEQRKDLERIEKLLFSENCSILGIEAKWGNGKSFIYEALKETLQARNVEILEINAIACNLDSLPDVLISGLERILYRNGIVSRYSKRLMTYFNGAENHLKFLGDIVFGNADDYSTNLSGLKEELNKIDKQVIISYDDLDRICDTALIRKIFYISEQLSGGLVKIIYQFDIDALMQQGFTKQYLHKYVPCSISLTRVPFHTILENEKDKLHNIALIKLDRDETSPFDFLYCQDFQKEAKNQGIAIDFISDGDIKLYLQERTTIREIKNFLWTVDAIYKNRNTSHDNYLKYSRQVIAMLYIKYVLPDLYSIIKNSTLQDSLKFDFAGKRYDITGLLKLEMFSDELEKIFSAERNFERYIAIILLRFENYDAFNELQGKKANISQEQIARKKFKSECTYLSQLRVVNNVTFAGTAEMEKYEHYAKKFIETILLEKDETKQYEQFQELVNSPLKDLRYINIFSIGLFSWGHLFKAFSSYDASDKEYIMLINFMFKLRTNDCFDFHLIDDLHELWNDVTLHDKPRVYICIIRKLVAMEIVGNMNTDRRFVDFLLHSLLLSYRTGFVPCLDSTNWQAIANENIQIFDAKTYLGWIQSARNATEDILNRFNRYDFCQLKQPKEDLRVIKNFFNWLERIVSYPKPYSARNDAMDYETYLHSGFGTTEEKLDIDVVMNRLAIGTATPIEVYNWLLDYERMETTKKEADCKG